MEEKKTKKGGRKKGTPNKPKAVKVLSRIVEDYTEYFNGMDEPGIYVNKADGILNTYLLACIALELTKRGKPDNLRNVL